MDAIKKVLLKDISSAMESLDQDKFEKIGRSGMYIIDNMAMANQKDLMFYGIFILEVAEEITYIKKINEEEIEESKIICQNFLKELFFQINEPLNINKVWNLFYEFKKELNSHNKSDVDLLVYNEENLDFTRLCTNMLLEHIIDNKELLIIENNGLLIGVLSEINRVIKFYGFENRDLIFFMLLSALIRFYIVFSKVDIKYIDDPEKLKKRIFPFIDNMVELLNDEKLNLEEINNLIGNVLYYSSIDIINYYAGIENKDSSEKKEKINLLPKKSREKIGKVIEEAVERELNK